VPEWSSAFIDFDLARPASPLFDITSPSQPATEFRCATRSTSSAPTSRNSTSSHEPRHTTMLTSSFRMVDLH
jgi:hypothetical protein